MTLFGQPWDLLLIAAVLGIVVPWRGVTRVRALLSRADLRTMDRLVMYASTIAFQWLATGLTVWRCLARGWNPTDMGLALEHTVRPILVGVAIAFVLAIFQVLGIRQMARTPVSQQGILWQLSRKLMPQNAVESFAFIALVSTVSVCEEFLYRGFAFGLFRQLWSSGTAALLGSSLLFAIGHLYQGRRGVISTFFLGLIFAAARAWTGNIVPGIIAHFVVDLIAGLLGPRMLRSVPVASEADGKSGAAYLLAIHI